MPEAKHKVILPQIGLFLRPGVDEVYVMALGDGIHQLLVLPWWMDWYTMAVFITDYLLPQMGPCSISCPFYSAVILARTHHQLQLSRSERVDQTHNAQDQRQQVKDQVKAPSPEMGEKRVKGRREHQKNAEKKERNPLKQSFHVPFRSFAVYEKRPQTGIRLRPFASKLTGQSPR